MKRLLIALMCLLFVSAATARQDDTACRHKGGYVNDEGKCILSIQIDIQIDYPLALAHDPLVASTIDPFIQSSKDEILSFVTGDFVTSPGAYHLQIDYDIVPYSDDIFTVVFSSYRYTGGAHGHTFTQTYTFDLANNRLITLDDLFAPDSDPFAVIAPIVESDLTDKLGDWADPGWIHEGTGENPDNYQDFALEPGVLIFYFEEYQVAPYVAGPQMVWIPLADLSAVLAPEFAP